MDNQHTEKRPLVTGGYGSKPAVRSGRPGAARSRRSVSLMELLEADDRGLH
jgi:hypothetical protein